MTEESLLDAFSAVEDTGEGTVSAEESLVDAFAAVEDTGEEALRRQHDEREEALAACMAEAGFVYHPTAWVPPEAGVDPTWNEEYVTTYGYGITTDPPVVEREPTPNEEYLASLSPAAREAYGMALNGTTNPALANDGGCYARLAELDSDNGQPVPALVQQIWEEIARRTEQKVDSDPRTVAARERISDCVADAGGEPYDVTQDSAASQVEERVAALGEAPGGEELAALQRWEIAVATAEFTCVEEHTAAYTEVEDEVLREVVGEHRAELESLAEQLP